MDDTQRQTESQESPTTQNEFDEAAIAEMFSSKKKKKKSRAAVAEPSHTTAEQSPQPPFNTCTQEPQEPQEAEDTYEELLARIYNKINGERADTSVSRLRLKPPRIERVGTKRTSWSNFRDTVAAINRPELHLQSFYNAELGAQSSIDAEGRLIIKGKFGVPYVESILKKYISTYVQCPFCRSTQTTLFRDPASRLSMMKCDFCLATRSLPSITQGFHATTKADRRETRAT